ncbi:hypothetical protein GCM10009826_40920 [Humibacillus xanthopallidus]
MLTADVLALTTNVDRHVAASTPPAPAAARPAAAPSDAADGVVADMATPSLQPQAARLPLRTYDAVGWSRVTRRG